MKALILAAGRGSRMKHMTETNPKGLVKLKGKQLVDYQIEALCASDILDIGIITGYMAEQYQSRSDSLFHNSNWQNTNMVASLRCAAKWLQEDTCVVTYSDIIYCAEAVKALAAMSGDIVITYDPDWRLLWEARFENPLDDCETFLADQSCRLIEIGKKPRTMDEVKGQYTGLFKLTPAGWSRIEALLDSYSAEMVAKMDMTSLLNILLSKGITIMCCPMQGKWGEVDEESDLDLYESWMRAGKMVFS